MTALPSSGLGNTAEEEDCPGIPGKKIWKKKCGMMCWKKMEMAAHKLDEDKWSIANASLGVTGLKSNQVTENFVLFCTAVEFCVHWRNFASLLNASGVTFDTL